MNKRQTTLLQTFIEDVPRNLERVDTATGVANFDTAPAEGVAITAGFEFDVPVRFDTDVLDVTLDLERLGSITSIPLLELRR